MNRKEKTRKRAFGKQMAAAKTVCALLLLLLTTATATGQIRNIGVRTNLLSWVLASPSLGVDVQWNGRWQATLDGHLSLLSSYRGGGKALYPRLSGYGAEARRYFDNGDYRGLYLAVNARYTQFDCLPTSLEGHEGIAYTVGPTVGYTLALPSLWGLNTDHWTVDAAIGAGYMYKDLNRYTWYAPASQNRLLGTESGSAFGVTHAELSLVYHFNL